MTDILDGWLSWLQILSEWLLLKIHEPSRPIAKNLESPELILKTCQSPCVITKMCVCVVMLRHEDMYLLARLINNGPPGSDIYFRGLIIKLTLSITPIG